IVSQNRSAPPIIIRATTASPVSLPALLSQATVWERSRRLCAGLGRLFGGRLTIGADPCIARQSSSKSVVVRSVFSSFSDGFCFAALGRAIVERAAVELERPSVTLLVAGF